MELRLTTPEKSFVISINEWCPINDKPGVTEIAIAILDKERREAFVNTMQYHSVRAELLGNGLILLDKPKAKKFWFDAKRNELHLNYS